MSDNNTDTTFEGSVTLEELLASDGIDFSPEPEVVKEAPVVEDEIFEEEIEIQKPSSKVEEVEEEVVQEEEEIVVEKELAKSTSAYSKAQTLLELGLLEDVRVAVTEDDEEGTLISEMKDLTDEQLTELLSASKKEKENDLSENYISKKDIPEHKQKIVEILKNGGSIAELFSNPDEGVKRPFENYDITTSDDQKRVMYSMLVGQKGLDKEDAIALIESKASKGTLATEAEDVYQAYQKRYDDYLNDQLVKSREEKQATEAKVKLTKQALTEKMKSADLKDAVIKKVVDNVTGRNAQGEEKILGLFKELLKDPEKNYETLLHIADPEAFRNIYKLKSQGAETKKIIKLIQGSNKTGAKKAADKVQLDEVPFWEQDADEFNLQLMKNKK